jgi:hypothetical protein
VSALVTQIPGMGPARALVSVQTATPLRVRYGLRDAVQRVATAIVVDPGHQSIGVSDSQEIGAALRINAGEIVAAHFSALSSSTLTRLGVTGGRYVGNPPFRSWGVTEPGHQTMEDQNEESPGKALTFVSQPGLSLFVRAYSTSSDCRTCRRCPQRHLRLWCLL